MGAVKPLLCEEGIFQSIEDEIVMVGDRYYVKATVTVTDGKLSHSVSALARESLTKKGQDDAQVTGSTSSYARKYALNGMYNIDDSKDADTNEFRQQATNNAQNQVKTAVIDFDKILGEFTNKASGANEQSLKAAFGDAWKKLSQSKQHQDKAKEVYDLRLSELTQQGN